MQASIVDGLIRAYNLHEYFSKIVNPIPATESNLALFHSSSYILYLKSKNTSNKSREGDVESSGESDDNDDDDADDDDGEEELNYGIGNLIFKFVMCNFKANFPSSCGINRELLNCIRSIWNMCRKTLQQ